jgi:hypothetical protein
MDMERLREIVGEDRTESAGTEAALWAGARGRMSSPVAAGQRTVRDMYCHHLHQIRLGNRGGAVVILAALLLGASMAVSKRLFPPIDPFLVGAISGLVPMVALMGYVRWAGREQPRRLQRLFDSPEGRYPSHVWSAATSLSMMTDRSLSYRLAAKHLASTGFAGTIFRLWRKVRPPPIQPLCVPFEPKPIDESDAAFVQLAEAGVSNGPEQRAGGAVKSAREPVLPPVLHRNIRLKGGYWIIALYVPLLAIGTLESFSRGTISFSLAFWGLWLLAFLLMPARTSSSMKKQWLMLPGGLLLREATKSTASNLLLFDATSSVLVAIQRPKKLWTLVVSDGRSEGWLNVTETEASVVLRAWCSPLRPPSVEHLSDFR